MILIRKSFLRNITEAILASQQSGKGRQISKLPRVCATLVGLSGLITFRLYACNSTSCHQAGAVVSQVIELTDEN